ncbi:MAG: sialidase family protein [Armatimonadota bacterium]
MAISKEALAPEAANAPSLLRDAPEIPVMQRGIVTKQGGLWPTIGALPDGSLLALGYNAPGHTTLPGDVGAWRSTDGGQNWQLHSQIIRPVENSNWCDSCWGLTKRGRLVFLTGGYADPEDKNKRRHAIETGAFISNDQGRSWKHDGRFPPCFPKGELTRPYGRIVVGHDGFLYTIAYAHYNDGGNGAYIVTSRDEGKHWDVLSYIAPNINEGALLPLKSRGHWLAEIRTTDRPAPELGQETRQFRSTDNGLSWVDEGLTAGYHCHPASLIALKDGRLLLTYGNRRNRRIEVRLSQDEGATWGLPMSIAAVNPGDMGYPSSVQRKDGAVVTVFYALSTALCEGYHMEAAIWKLPEG